MIPVEELEIGATYRVHARNFTVAVWTGEYFVGNSTKFGLPTERTEMHWDTDPKYGTVKPLEKI